MAELAAFVQNEAYLAHKLDDGATRRQHFEAAFAASGRRPEQLEPIELHPTVMYLVADFFELNAARTGGFGPNPISFTEINAWASLKGIALTPFEIAAIRRMDNAFLSQLAAEPKTK